MNDNMPDESVGNDTERDILTAGVQSNVRTVPAQTTMKGTPGDARGELSTNGEVDYGVNLLRAFSVDAFDEWPSWIRVARLLIPTPTQPEGTLEDPPDGAVAQPGLGPRGGGAYGLAGPRGVGKTWHMQRAVEFARDGRGFGLWYPSPSEYDSLAFLASLTEAFANEVERSKRRGRTMGYATLGRPIRLLITVYLAAAAGVGAAFAAYYTLPLNLLPVIVLGVAVGAGAAALWEAFSRWRLAQTDFGRLLIFARELRRAVRFSMTRRETSELAAQAGKTVLGKLRRSQEIELVERPITLATLVQDFRELAGLAATAAFGPVVVAVDELDKMTEHDKVRQLLRDIKGVFGVPNVYFLVSVSHEAARALNLNGLTERNEFNSSFDTVIELPLLDTRASEQLLISRGFPGPKYVARALGALSAGVPRDLVRLGELVISDPDAYSAMSAEFQPPGTERPAKLEAAIAATMRIEALELVREVVAAGASSPGRVITDDAKVGVFGALPEDGFVADHFPEFAARVSEEHWEPAWADREWEERFGESWRRLMVRMAVAARLVHGDNEAPGELRRVVAVSSQSAAVARRMLQGPNGQVAD